MLDSHEHFTSVAPDYRRLRTTDEEPIKAIHNALDGVPKLVVADIGCGTGRYSQLLYEYLGPGTRMFCVDATRAMLDELGAAIHPDTLPNFVPIQARASALPFGDNTMDVITSFNAIHHFDLAGFLTDASRVLKEDGNVFLYTRLREQNAKTIWGRFFPNFCEMETRLYTRSELLDYINRHFQPARLFVTPFSFYRQASLEALLEQAKGRHYSTFSLYDQDEFDCALREFERGIREAYSDPYTVGWTESYTLLSLAGQDQGNSDG
ncbi:MAG: class I SAM-dependent methyltransferase [Dehalococcoidia bacterium]